ncbi:MAG: N-acetylmuramoyl-L-alanine amidase [Proteobacteria bacterium]|nr:N-acetylmuramoyl-L-alanine amidase [Pseudomonadota bacterium]
MKRRDFLIGGALGTMAAGSALAAPAPKGRKPAAPKPKAIIALDAGHGGKDPGTIGVGGTFEKDITFAVARGLAHRLEASGRYQIVLTRTDDSFIALGERVRSARASRAQLFLSLHADSVPNPRQRGFSVYTLADEASDAMTAGLAVRENAVDRLGGLDLSRHPQAVRTILLDLMHRETANNASLMAETVVTKLHPPFTPLQKPHRQANFAVLRAPDIPSILVEMGFLSNLDDEKLLNQTSYQAKLADRLVIALDGFFARVPAA